MQVYRIVAEKTSVSALCSSPESGLTREKLYILEHGDTERLYCVETSPSHLTTNQVSTSILKCCIRFSTLRPLELISTLLGRAYSLCQLEGPPRRKLGKWEKSRFYVLETCGNP